MRNNYFDNLTTSLISNNACVTSVADQSALLNSNKFSEEKLLHLSEQESDKSVTESNTLASVTHVSHSAYHSVTGLSNDSSFNCKNDKYSEHMLHPAHLSNGEMTLKEELFYLIEQVGKYYGASKIEIIEMQQAETVLSNISHALNGFRILAAQIGANSVNQHKI